MDKKNSGYTLIEILVTISLMLVVFFAISSLADFVFGQFRTYGNMTSVHQAEVEARRAVMGISSDFRMGSTGREVVIGADALGSYLSFEVRTFQPLPTGGGISDTRIVTYSLEPHPTRAGYYTIVRQFMGTEAAPLYWQPNTPVMPMPVAAVRAFEVVPLNGLGEPAVVGDEIAFLNIQMRMGVADRLYNQNSAMFGPGSLDALGRPLGPLDPFEMRIAVNRTPVVNNPNVVTSPSPSPSPSPDPTPPGP